MPSYTEEVMFVKSLYVHFGNPVIIILHNMFVKFRCPVLRQKFSLFFFVNTTEEKDGFGS